MNSFTIILSFILAVAVTAKFADNIDELFSKFKITFSRKYASTDEELKRKAIFVESMIRVDKNNELNGSPVFGVTKFSDWSQEEFSVLLGRKNKGRINPKMLANVRSPTETHKWNYPKHRTPPVAGSVPTAVNWAAEGLTTPIKNQGVS